MAKVARVAPGRREAPGQLFLFSDLQWGPIGPQADVGFQGTFATGLLRSSEKDVFMLPTGSTRAGEAKPARILLIEDSQDILFLMKMELQNLGYSVLTAKDAEAGLELARRELPDVIISDIKMPGVDGLEFIKRARMTPELASTPPIALTGYDTEQDIQAGLAAGTTPMSASRPTPANFPT